MFNYQLLKKINRRLILDYSAYLVVRVLICCLQAMSLERCDRYCRLLAIVLSDWLPLRRSVVDSNLKLVFPHWSERRIRRVRTDMWHHLLLMVCEIAQAPRKIHRTNWRDHVEIPEDRQLVGAVMANGPLIVVTGHFGNFELGGFVTGMYGLPTTTIARPLDNPFVHNFLNRFRSTHGQHMLPKEGSSGDVQRILEAKGTLALLADQYAGSKGCWVDFMGHPASCHKALALFTIGANAPMMVVDNLRLERPLKFRMSCLGIADPSIDGELTQSMKGLTQWYNDLLGESIRRNPAQYWWVHRRWREPPPKIAAKWKAAA